MASYRGSRFPRPAFNEKFPRNTFNMNTAGNRPSMQPFQIIPNRPYQPFQPPERFMHGNFQNRSHFSNFPEPLCPSGFRNRPPPPNQIFPDTFRGNPGYIPRPRGHFEQPFRPLNRMPSFRGLRPQLQNRPRPPVSSHPYCDLPLQGNQKRKQKSREFRKLKSWMTDELFAEVKKKNTLYLKAKSSDEQTAWQEFRLQRNRVSSLIKEAKIKAGLISRKMKEEDTTEKPFSCDTCDRAFITESELKDHLSQHIKCDHTNCTFEAHPKIVALHKKMQHDTGYAERINKLKDDTEIQKWREERKKRFPTAETVKKRKAEQAEKEARGEVLETKEFGKIKRRREGNGNTVNKDGKRRRNQRFRKFNDRRNFHPRLQHFTINVDSESDSDSDSHITLNKFLGMSSLTNSAKEININEDVEVSSSPHGNIYINDKHQFPSESSYEQNLPKSDFDNSVCHPNVSFADRSSSNVGTDQTTFVLNDEKFNDAYDSVCEVSINESGLANKKSPKDTLKDFASAANKSVCEIPVDESESIEQTEVIDIGESDDEGPIGIPVIKSSSAALDKDIEEIETSNDEGPIAVPIMKSFENSVAVDKDVKKIENGQLTLSPSSNTSLKVSNIANTEIKHINNDRRSHHPRKHRNYLNNQSDGQHPVHVARKSTLLEKLLADDIRHERNVILQCIRHIVKNNFLELIKDK